MHSLFAKVCCGVENEPRPSEHSCVRYNIKEPQGREVVSQLANFVIFPPPRPVKHYLMLQKSVLPSASLPQRRGRARHGSTRHSMNEHLITINKKPNRCQKALIQQNEEEERGCLSARTPAHSARLGRRSFERRGRVGSGWCLIR